MDRRDFGQALEALRHDSASQRNCALAVLFDGVTDIGNVGAILRSADQFEVDIVALPERRSAGNVATLTSTSAGASAYVQPLRIPNVARAIQRLQQAGFWVYGAEARGDPLTEVDLSGNVALVLGDEHNGLRSLTRKHCDRLIAIPTGGHLESLNVSVAAAILMYETRRQQRYWDAH